MMINSFNEKSQFITKLSSVGISQFEDVFGSSYNYRLFMNKFAINPYDKLNKDIVTGQFRVMTECYNSMIKDNPSPTTDKYLEYVKLEATDWLDRVTMDLWGMDMIHEVQALQNIIEEKVRLCIYMDSGSQALSLINNSKALITGKKALCDDELLNAISNAKIKKIKENYYCNLKQLDSNLFKIIEAHLDPVGINVMNSQHYELLPDGLKHTALNDIADSVIASTSLD